MMQQLLSAQYENIRSTRLALLSYCDGLNQADLHQQIPTFNNNTVAAMLLHTANTYMHWLVKVDQAIALPYFEIDDTTNISDVKLLYEQVDKAVYDFLGKYGADYAQILTKDLPNKGIQITTTPLQLFTHVITHEFHHKGQILTMTRLLGYTPIDTDVIRY